MKIEALESNVFLIATKYVLEFYFGKIDLETIHSFSNKKSDSFDAEDSLEILNSLELVVMQRRLKIEELAKHFFPSIIYDEKENVGVLLNIEDEKVTLFNANTNMQEELTLDEAKKYTQILLVFKDGKYTKDLEETQSRKWFFEPIKAHYKAYIEIGVLTLFINLFALAVPLFSMSVYDRVVPNQAYETLFVLSLGVLIILAFDLLFKYVRTHILENIAKKLGLYWEELLMKKMIYIDASQNQLMTGSKANLFKELQQVRDFFAIRSVTQIIDFPFFFIALLVIYLISPLVATVPFVFALLIVFFNFAIQNSVDNLSKKNGQNVQNRYSFIVESIEGSESIKLSNAAAARMFDWKNIVSVTDAVAMKMQSLNALSMNISQMVVQLVIVFVVIVGVYEISNQNLTVGGLIAVTILSSRTMIPIVNLSSVLVKLKEITESIERLTQFLSLPSEDQKMSEIGTGKLQGAIEFKNVSYSFKNSKYRSVFDISFLIKPGEKIGIIGQTGAGKSTILKLLTGLHSPNEGSIFLDNHDIDTLHRVEIRQNIGVMMQEPFLFSGTLKENIELSKPISKERLMEVIALTGLEELVKKSGKGDALEVGERGANLSVGQRHLVALARAIVENPSILILDEPTTGLDTGLEKKLVSHLKSVIENKTIILITHRFAALELVDRVIVLHDGKIVADGPRDAILKALNTPLNNTTRG